MNHFIVVDPNICSGKPVIKGTRIMVKNILGMVAGGYSVDRIVKTYPELTSEMIQAALEYAAAVIDDRQLLHVPEEVLNILLDQNIPQTVSG